MSQQAHTSAPPFVVVDDDVDHVVIVRTVLSMIAPDAEVTVHTDTHDVLGRLIEAPRGAIVVIDRLLGSRESFPLIADVLEQRPDLQVALLSAALSEQDRARALDAGAGVAAEKPGSIDGWRSLLSDLIDRRPPPQRSADV